MARQIFLRFVAGPGGPLEGAVIEDGEAQPFSLRADRVKRGDVVVVFVPGTEIGCHELALPARNEREAQRAAPFAIEDELASASEGVHVALSPKDAEQMRRVLTCESALMAAWLDRLQADDVDVAALVPEFAVLPPEDCAVDVGERVLLRVNGRPLALDADGPDDLLRALIATSNDTVQVYGRALADRLGTPMAGAVAPEPVATLAWMATDNAIGHDLRQGAFAPRQSLSLPQLKVWRRPLALAAAGACAWLGLTVWETAALSQAGQDLRAAASAAYAGAFADEGRVPDPARRIRDKLDAGAGRGLDFEASAALLIQALEEMDGARLRTLRYDRLAGEMRASVDYGRYGDDLRLAQALTERGLNATLGDTRTSGTLITGDVTLGAVR